MLERKKSWKWRSYTLNLKYRKEYYNKQNKEIKIQIRGKSKNQWIRKQLQLRGSKKSEIDTLKSKKNRQSTWIMTKKIK